IEADFDLHRCEAHPGLNDAADLIHTPYTVVTNRRIEREFCAPGTAKELIDGLAWQLAFEVPQGNIDSRQRPGIRSLRTNFYMLMEQTILEHAVCERVGTHEHGRKCTGDDFQRGIAIGHGTGLPQTVETIVSPDADPGAFVLAPIDVKRFDAGDVQHRASS